MVVGSMAAPARIGAAVFVLAACVGT